MSASNTTVRIWAIVPVKPFHQAKTRLAAALSPDERQKLARDCADRTLNTLRQVTRIERVVMVSRDETALAMARAHGATALRETGRPTLNAALAQAMAFAQTQGADAALILPGDLPFVTPDDIAQLVDEACAGDGPCMGIAPDRHNEGTNALFLRPPCAIKPAFGKGSFARHTRLAQKAALRLAVRHLPGFGLDLDTADDLKLYRSHTPFRARRSIRRYTEQPVSRDTLERLLAAATWAPSAHNRQPWRFAVLTRRGDRERLARAMGDQLRQDRLADGAAPGEVEADVQRSQARIANAPAAIVACATMQVMDDYPDEKRRAAEEVMAAQSVAMAVQNLLLAADAEGLGACWMCAPLFCGQAVTRSLDLPSDWQPQALITLGYPSNGGKPASRAALRKVAVWFE